jgi:tetratricopeptide (TPR) repeat protein
MMSSEKKRPFQGWVFPLSLAALLATATIGVWTWWRPVTESSPPAPASRPIEIAAARPEPRPQGYAGSEACGKCHAAIAETYASHPMYRSAGRTPGIGDVENFEQGTEFESGGRIYRVVKEGDAIYHHELLLDDAGEIISDQAAKISFFFGSGVRGKSYAIDRGGLLFQSPISWYTRDERWDLSPATSSRQARFGRRITEGCVQCHAGRPTHDDSRDNFFPQPVLMEAAIGCERCHGPGETHIAFHEAPAGALKKADTIVNPARLHPDRREAVCYQCHLIGEMRLPRYGRSFGDFRPGDRLDDVWATLVVASTVRGDKKTKAVSQVEQMRQSTCFNKSEGRMGCHSCHDPHAVPSGNAAAYYRQRCLDCHAERRCTASEEDQAAAPANNSCTHCHMPRLSAHDIAHASQTDHRILRNPEEGADVYLGAEAAELVLFDAERATMPEWEIERAETLATVAKLRESGYVTVSMAEELTKSLDKISEIAPDDPQTWAALAMLFELRGNQVMARKHWEHVLALRPNDERALEALVALCQTTEDYQAGLAFLDRLIELNPHRARDHMRRAMMLAEEGQWRQALADGERAVEIEPSDKAARQWLIDAYQQSGNSEAGRRHAEMLRRMSAFPRRPR